MCGEDQNSKNQRGKYYVFHGEETNLYSSGKMLREYDWQQTMDSYIVVHYTRSHALLQMNGESIAPSHALKFPPLNIPTFSSASPFVWYALDSFAKKYERESKERTRQCPSQWLRDLRECQSVVGWHTPLYHRLRQSPVSKANTTRSFDEFDEYEAKKKTEESSFSSVVRNEKAEKKKTSNRIESRWLTSIRWSDTNVHRTHTHTRNGVHWTTATRWIRL